MARKAAMPEDHPRLLGSIANLALLRADNGDLDVAEELFVDALRRIDERRKGLSTSS